MLFNIVWLTGAMMAATGLRIHHPVSIGIYAMYAGQIFWMLRQLGSYWFVTAVLYPIPLVFFFLVFANSILHSRGTVTWKGRTIHAG
jgi:4,4'-diaponeurosporenoate glycosyltransferase